MVLFSRITLLLTLVVLCASPVFAGIDLAPGDDVAAFGWDPQGFWATGDKWYQEVPGGLPQELYDLLGPPTPAEITYSYVNLMKGKPTDGLVRSIIEEALGLWASYAPLHFTEMVDVGEVKITEERYEGDQYADIRFSLHDFDGIHEGDLAHAYYPSVKGNLGGDVHFNSLMQWSISPVDLPYVDLLEVAVHELGHALGLEHVPSVADGGVEVIMNPKYVGRYHGLGTAYLLPGDIAGIQSIYGEGVGSVTPLPEPGVAAVLVAGMLLMAGRRRGF